MGCCPPLQGYFKELFRVSKQQIIWGGNYFELPPCKGFIIWQKPGISETEIDKRFFALQEERFKQVCKQQSLFEIDGGMFL